MSKTLTIKLDDGELLETIKKDIEEKYKVEVSIFTTFEKNNAPTWKQKSFAKNIAKELGIEFDVNNSDKKTISDFISEHKDAFFEKKEQQPKEHLPNPENENGDTETNDNKDDDLPF